MDHDPAAPEAGGFRRSELVALELADLRFVLEVLVRRSKTDQEGRGRRAEVAYGGDPMACPESRQRPAQGAFIVPFIVDKLLICLFGDAPSAVEIMM